MDNCTTGYGNISQSARSATDPWSVGTLLSVYSTIFVLAVVGNGLVILTLVQNKRMRTVTNVFLLNLAISDLLLAVFCMPFTLIPVLIKNFIFGPVMCLSIRYAQGISVGASGFTLVAISLERYFAICRPLASRRWQTRSHAYKIVGVCWLLSAIIFIPIPVTTRHTSLAPGRALCREIWGNESLERAYTVFLDVVLLLIPLCLMTGAYTRIMITLYTGIRHKNGLSEDGKYSSVAELVSLSSLQVRSYVSNGNQKLSPRYQANTYFSKHKRESDTHENSPTEEPSSRKKIEKTRIIRQTNYEKSRRSKLRVIRMLFVVVIEFFVCWTPLYVVQTWQSFHPESINQTIDRKTWSAMFVLAYFSSCCNPITYCFMNRRFRQSFVSALSCCLCFKKSGLLGRIPSMSSTKNRTSIRRLTWVDRGVDSSSSPERNGFIFDL